MKIPECITSSGMHHIWRLKLMCIPRDNIYNTTDIITSCNFTRATFALIF